MYQIFWKSFFIKDYRNFIVSHPSRIDKEFTPEEILVKFESSLIGELTRGHIFYDKLIADYFDENNIINYFIYRDPRDVVISEVNYLYKQNKFRINP